MSRLYETLRRMEMEHRQQPAVPSEEAQPVEVLSSVMAKSAELEGARSAKLDVSPASRLVALTDPKALGAEKFRALVTRLENLGQERELKSLQVTSAAINEGKTLVTANLAVTLAKHAGYQVLVVEGDLHRPTLASLFGLPQLEGLSHWWDGRDEKERIAHYVHRLNDLPLWFLSAGTVCDQPSQILQSARFAETFVRLASWFDWVVVDSAPMLPTVEVNLWSRLVDGTLLVVREGVTPIRALKKGVEGLDNPKWVGMVLNEASEFDGVNYTDQYYALTQDNTDLRKVKK